MDMADTYQDLVFIKHTDRNKPYRGFKTDLLVNPLTPMEQKYLICSICSGIMRQACINQKTGEQMCEQCTGSGIGRDIVMNEQARNLSLHLNVKCPLGNRGCQWVGTLFKIQIHLDSCLHFNVECPSKCSAVICRSSLVTHAKSQCDLRSISCKHCGLDMISKSMPTHLTECLEVALNCENKCDAVIKRKNLNEHYETDCPNTTVQCQYIKYGCEFSEIKRCELSKHELEFREIHVNKMALSIENRIDKLESENAILVKKNAELTSRIVILEETQATQQSPNDIANFNSISIKKTATPIEIDYGGNSKATLYELKMTEIKEKIDAMLANKLWYIESPIFLIGKYSFSIHITLLESNKNMLAFNLRASSNPINFGPPRPTKCLASLVNHGDEKEPFNFNAIFINQIEPNKIYLSFFVQMFPQIKITNLLSPKYCIHNCILLRLQLNPTK